ncbi:MAG: F0F1 ATP synthase subunit B [Lachnospiraceae bacterium]
MTTAEETERLFGLDAQTLFDTAITALNVFILFILLSYILFNPVRNMLKKRQDKITSDRESAIADKESAQALKLQYEEKLRDIDKEADVILGEARKKALQRAESIVNEAKEEAAKIIQHANQEAELEKKRVADEVKQEMITVASAMAAKVVAGSIDAKVSDELIEQTLNEMGDDTWRS